MENIEDVTEDTPELVLWMASWRPFSPNLDSFSVCVPGTVFRRKN